MLTNPNLAFATAFNAIVTTFHDAHTADEWESHFKYPSNDELYDSVE